MLFTIAIDVLSRILVGVEDCGILEGFLVGRSRTRVSHLQFADDTIFFSNARAEEFQNLKIILLIFGHILGLMINLDNNTLLGIHESRLGC